MPPPPPSRLTLPFALPLLLLITSLLRVHSAPAPGNHHGHSHRFAKIVAFGDSWSDTGNFYRRVSNGTWPPAALGYDGGRYSNGPVWLETVALPRFLDAELVDFAYGGASTNGATVRGISGPSNTPSPSVNEQIDNDFANYLKNNSIGTETLYTMWSGANDFFEDFFLYHYNLTAEKIATDVVTNVKTIVDRYGALYIVVLNIPNPARFPILASVSQPGIDHLQSLAIQFNKSLKEKVKQFNRDTLKVRVLYYDFFSLFEQLVTRPSQFGFTNVVQPCVDTSSGTPTVCSDADGHLFWDAAHYSAKTHALIGEFVATEILRYF